MTPKIKIKEQRFVFDISNMFTYVKLQHPGVPEDSLQNLTVTIIGYVLCRQLHLNIDNWNEIKYTYSFYKHSSLDNKRLIENLESMYEKLLFPYLYLFNLSHTYIHPIVTYQLDDQHLVIDLKDKG